VKSDRSTQVSCVHIDSVLEAALADWGAVDLLKIDVEGMEARLLEVARPELLRRVGTVYVEGRRRELPLPAGLEARERCETVRLRPR
jgi:FkbM family methyltransferase